MTVHGILFDFTIVIGASELQIVEIKVCLPELGNPQIIIVYFSPFFILFFIRLRLSKESATLYAVVNPKNKPTKIFKLKEKYLINNY